jgi:hypothetical protein
LQETEDFMSKSAGVCAIIPTGQDGLSPQVFGMGILVSPTVVVTCAHVVRDVLNLAGGSPIGRPISICFPFAPDQARKKGVVDAARWFPPGNVPGALSDIAVIVLDEAAPASVEPAVLKRHSVTQSGIDKPTAYGFRSVAIGDTWRSHPRGEHAVGDIVGSLPGGMGQFDGNVFSGAKIERGYSGAGVHDPHRGAVVGMVVEASKDPGRRIANFIDASSLCRALGISEAALDYRPQAALIEKLRANFVGRTKAIGEIEAWIKAKGAPAHCVIEAPAGYGKSALLARLLKRHPEWIYHFVREEDQQHTATTLLQSLCAQLSDRLGETRAYEGLLPTDLKKEFVRLQERAKHLFELKGLAIVVDGLDESVREGSENVLQPELFRLHQPSCRFLI